MQRCAEQRLQAPLPLCTATAATISPPCPPQTSPSSPPSLSVTCGRCQATCGCIKNSWCSCGPASLSSSAPFKAALPSTSQPFSLRCPLSPTTHQLPTNSKFSLWTYTATCCTPQLLPMRASKPSPPPPQTRQWSSASAFCGSSAQPAAARAACPHFFTVAADILARCSRYSTATTAKRMCCRSCASLPASRPEETESSSRTGAARKNTRARHCGRLTMCSNVNGHPVGLSHGPGPYIGAYSYGLSDGAPEKCCNASVDDTSGRCAARRELVMWCEACDVM